MWIAGQENSIILVSEHNVSPKAFVAPQNSGAFIETAPFVKSGTIYRSKHTFTDSGTYIVMVIDESGTLLNKYDIIEVRDSGADETDILSVVNSIKTDTASNLIKLNSIDSKIDSLPSTTATAVMDYVL